MTLTLVILGIIAVILLTIFIVMDHRENVRHREEVDRLIQRFSDLPMPPVYIPRTVEVSVDLKDYPSEYEIEPDEELPSMIVRNRTEWV